jgi:hypothetical protein
MDALPPPGGGLEVDPQLVNPARRVAATGTTSFVSKFVLILGLGCCFFRYGKRLQAGDRDVLAMVTCYLEKGGRSVLGRRW